VFFRPDPQSLGPIPRPGPPAATSLAPPLFPCSRAAHARQPRAVAAAVLAPFPCTPHGRRPVSLRTTRCRCRKAGRIFFPTKHNYSSSLPSRAAHAEPAPPPRDRRHQVGARRGRKVTTCRRAPFHRRTPLSSPALSGASPGPGDPKLSSPCSRRPCGGLGRSRRPLELPRAADPSTAEAIAVVVPFQ
jgi:hypothetical protein